MNKIIEFKNVDFRYADEDRDALNNLNLDFYEGQFTCVLGHNGSGKSTMAKLINALEYPTKGSVITYGYDTNDEKNEIPIRRKVGMVFQNPDNQIVATIVEDDVAFGPENLGIPRDEIRKRVDEALKLVDMYDYRKHEPHRLSGGQKQRVAIAGVIAMQTNCIVLDCLTRAILHKRNVLMGSSVEHKVRAVLTQYIVQAVGIPDGTNENLQIQLRMGPLQFHLDLIGVIFVNIEDDQLSGVCPGDLTAKLTADGAAAAGDHDGLAGNVAHDLIQIYLDGITAQKILGIHLAQLADADFAVDHLEDAGKHLHFAACGGADIQNFLADCRRSTGDGIDDLADLEFLHHSGNIIPVAYNGHTAQPLIQLAGIVVNDAGQVILHIIAGVEFIGQCTACITATDQHDIFHACGMGHVTDLPLQRTKQPVGKPNTHSADKAEHITNNKASPGHDRSVHVKNDTQNTQHSICANSPVNLRCADKDPDTVIQFEQPEHQNMGSSPQADGRGKVLPEVGFDLFKYKVKPEPQAKEIARNNGNYIYKYDQHYP